MAIDFPASPSVNDIHTSGGKRWTWNGTSWERSGTPGPGDTISATNDNTTSTLYPVLVTGTGSNTAKIATSSSKSVSFNASNGNLTATTFTGTLNTAAQTNITSVGTLGSLNVTGNVSVGGVLTYEDVTNIDSVGIITARAAVSIADSIVHTGDTNTALRFPAADTFTVETAGDERLRITSSGLTIKNGGAGGGIGINATADPAHYGLLSCNANRSTENDVLLGISGDWNADSVAAIYFRAGGDTTNKDDGTLTFHTQTSGTNTLSERLRITTAGKVGIGSAIPSNQLDVAGGADVLGIYRDDYTGTGGAGLNLNFGGAKANGDLFNCAKITAVRGDNTAQAGELRFSVLTGGTMSEKVRITSDGQILLAGATTSTAHADADDLVLNERSGSNVGITFKNAGTGYGVIYFADNSSQHSGRIQYDHSNDTLDLFAGGDERVVIHSSGQLEFKNGTFSNNVDSIMGNGGTLEIGAQSTMKFRTATNEVLRIDSSGHIHTGYTTNVTGADHVNILASDGGGVSVAQNNAGNATSGTTIGSYSFQGYHQGSATFANAEARISAIAAANHTGSSAATDLAFYTKPAATGPGSSPDERLRIKSDGVVNIGDRVDNTWIDSTLKVRKDQNAVTKIAVRNENSGSSASSAIIVNSYGNSWMFDCGSAAKNSNALTIRVDATSNSNQGTEKLKIATDGVITSSATHPQVILKDPSGRQVSLRAPSTSNNAALGTDSSHALLFYTNGYSNERLRIRNDGKLQIGSVGGNSTYLTTSTNAALDIWGDGSAYPTLRLGTEVLDTEGEDIRFGRTDHGATDIRYHSIISRHMSSGASNYLQFRIHDGGGSPFQSQKTVLHLNGLGNMGLGTDSPNHYNNYSTITLNGATGGEIDFEDDGTLLGDHFCNVNGHYFTAGRSAAMPFIWQTHNGGSVGQRMQLTATGQLNIGGDLTQTAYQTQITGDLLLQKNQAAYQHPQLELYATNTGAYGGAIKFTGHYNSKYELALIKAWGGNGSPGSNGGALTIHTGDGTEKIRIQADGNINFGVNEPIIRVDSSNSSNGSALRVEIDGTEQFRFDPSSITYKDATNTARGTLIGPLNYHLDTNGYVNLSQWYLGTDWNVLEVFGYINPNSAGSGAYTDPLHMYIYRGIGWDQANNVTAHWIYSVHVAPPARQVFPSGSGMSGNSGISAVWYHPSRGIVGNKSSNGADYLRLVIPNANQSYNYQKNFRIMRRY